MHSRSSAPNQDLYKVLGLTPASTQDDIKKGYRRIALQCHPDKVPEADRASATVRFQLLLQAFEVLSDPKKRKEYDNSRRKTAFSPSSPYPGGRKEDYFNGKQPSSQAKPPPYHSVPRCDGCDRLCEAPGMRKCPQCWSRICSRCTLCAACIPADGGVGGPRPSNSSNNNISKNNNNSNSNNSNNSSKSNSKHQSAPTNPASPASPTSPTPAASTSASRPTPQPQEQKNSSSNNNNNNSSKSSSSNSNGNKYTSDLESERLYRGHQRTPFPHEDAKAFWHRESDDEDAAAGAPMDDEASRTRPLSGEPPRQQQQQQQQEQEPADEVDRNLVEALVVMGFAEKDAYEALKRHQTAAAAVAWLMGMFRSTTTTEEPRGPTDGSQALVPSNDRPNVGGASELLGVWSHQVSSWVQSALASDVPSENLSNELSDSGMQLQAQLVALGFSDLDAFEAARRCSSVEAAVEWILKKADAG